MTQQQFNELIAALGQHGWLEDFSWVAIVVTAIAAAITAGAAIYAFIFARQQIQAARDQLAAAHLGTKATFLADLDHRWEGNEMKASRGKWLAMRDHIEKLVDGQHNQRPVEFRRQKVSEECSAYLFTLRATEPSEYNDIMSILGFFETLGYASKRGFIPPDEIVDLYGESILEFDRLCSEHIQKRIEESKNRTGMPTKLFEHACSLIVHARRIYTT